MHLTPLLVLFLLERFYLKNLLRLRLAGAVEARIIRGAHSHRGRSA